MTLFTTILSRSLAAARVSCSIEEEFLSREFLRGAEPRRAELRRGNFFFSPLSSLLPRFPALFVNGELLYSRYDLQTMLGLVITSQTDRLTSFDYASRRNSVMTTLANDRPSIRPSRTYRFEGSSRGLNTNDKTICKTDRLWKCNRSYVIFLFCFFSKSLFIK